MLISFGPCAEKSNRTLAVILGIDADITLVPVADSLRAAPMPPPMAIDAATGAGLITSA
jgi:hypothetical protein